MRLTLGAVLALLCGSSFAGFAQVNPPTGWGGSASSGWTFNPPANSPWVNGSAAGGVTQNVGGRAINMPAAMRMAANAGSYAAKAARITPGGIVTAAVASWLLTEGIAWINNQWQTRPDYAWPYANAYYNYANGSAVCRTAVPDAAFALCGALAQLPNNTHNSCRIDTGPLANGTGTMSCINVQNGVRVSRSYSRLNCPAGQVLLTTGQCGPQPSPQYVPSTDTDWSKFNNKPVPDQVADDIDVPLPVGLPAINPDPAGNPQPYRVPVGDPQPMPGTAPATVKQPVVDIVPKPTLDEPWRVDVQPKEIIGTDPNGQQQPGTPPSGQPAPTPLTPEQVQLCEAYPDIAACKPLGTPEADEPLPTQNVPLQITPFGSFGPSSAACPAPRQTVLASGFVVSMPYDLICTFVDGLRPLIIAFAWVASVFAFLGIARKGD